MSHTCHTHAHMNEEAGGMNKSGQEDGAHM